RINSASGTIELGEWQHYAFTLDGSHAKFYKDGELIGETFSSNGKNSNWGHFDIGKNSSSTINGQIDEFRMWSTARTQQEIRDNMHNALSGSESGLELYLQFNTTTGNVVDLSSNGYEVATFSDPTRVTSTAAVGTVGEFVNTQTETAVGDAGKQLKTTITSTPSSTDYLGIYRTGSGTQKLFTETYPSGITWRYDVFWGVQEFGTVTADLVIDFSTIPDITDASLIKLLKRTDVSSAWTDVTSDFVLDVVNRTFTKTGETSFSEFAIAGTLTAVNDTYNMPEGTTINVPAGGVLGNDFGAGTSVTAVIDTSPASGSFTLNSDGSFDYTPPAAFSGTVTFTYHTNEGANNSNVATVTINVIGANMSIADGGSMEADLSWALTPVLICQYDIYRAAEPYDNFSIIADDWNSLTFSDTNGAIGTVGTDYYYYLEVVNCPGTTLTPPPSDTVGEFDFAIVPGS
ncbi:MAG: LamG-like jellyroll fold domain-containing protein, partial [Chloroflexota bacterium]